MALGGEAPWKREGSSLRKYQEIKRGVQTLGQNRYLHCWQSLQTSSVMWIHLFMPVPASVTDRHPSFRTKRFPLSTLSPHSLTLFKANKPTQCRLREECRLVGTPASLCSAPCSKQGYLQMAQDLFSWRLEGLQRWIFCSLGCSSLTQGLSTLLGNFFPQFPDSFALAPACWLLSFSSLHLWEESIFSVAPGRSLKGKIPFPAACSFLCCTTLGPCSAFSPGCQDCSCSRRSQMWTHGVPDEASRAAEPRTTILSLCLAGTLVLRRCLASSRARIHSWLCSPWLCWAPFPSLQGCPCPAAPAVPWAPCASRQGPPAAGRALSDGRGGTRARSPWAGLGPSSSHQLPPSRGHLRGSSGQVLLGCWSGCCCRCEAMAAQEVSHARNVRHSEPAAKVWWYCWNFKPDTSAFFFFFPFCNPVIHIC